MSTRRTFLGRALGASSAFFAARTLSAQTMQMQMPMPPATAAPANSHHPPPTRYPLQDNKPP